MDRSDVASRRPDVAPPLDVQLVRELNGTMPAGWWPLICGMDRQSCLQKKRSGIVAVRQLFLIMISRLPSHPLVLLLLLVVSQASAFYSPSPIEHDFKKPAFISFLPETGPDTMLVTSFDILCTECRLSVVNTSSMQTTVLASLNWPNAATFCPAAVCATPSLLVLCPHVELNCLT